MASPPTDSSVGGRFELAGPTPVTVSPKVPADLVIHNARVFTAGLAAPFDGGVAIKSGRISAVGRDGDLRRLVGSSTETLDASGGLLAPGFIDAHVHPITGGLKLFTCSLYGANSALEAVEAVRSYAAAYPALEWITGGGWSLEWFERGTPAATLLDAVESDRPVFLYNRDGHGAWVNSRALQLAGIGASTPDPPDGRIERDRDGHPQGTLQEGAMHLIERILPPVTAGDWEKALLSGQDYLLSFGITGWQDADVRPAQDAAYLTVAGRGGLVASAVGALWWERDRGLEQVEQLLARRAAMAPRYRPTTVKLMLDGIVENFTAAMLDPYLDGRGGVTPNAGLDFIHRDDLRRIVILLDRLGFQCHFHAIGDRAVRHALDAVEGARTVNGHSGPTHHIAHLQVIQASDLDRFARLGVAANAQPLWACNEPQMVDLTLPFLSPAQAVRQYPFASLLRAGAVVAMGSDWSVSPPDVMQQIEVAVTRRHPAHPEQEPFLAGEAIALAEALTAYTLGSARVNRAEGRVGTIEVGKTADLVLLDRDPFRETPIGETRVRHTIIDGAVVYRVPQS